MSETEITRREDSPDALATIVGTGNARAALAQLEQNVKDVVAVARDRGFVARYGDSKREFYGLPAWQLLGMVYGVTAIIEWTRPIDNGFKARAIAKRLQNDQVVGAAEGMCTRTDKGKRDASDDTLLAMAESRAQRRALRRSPLGAVLVLADFDFADPDAPATKEQVGVLHQLERQLGWSHKQGHDRAGVASYKDLTREEASEFIEEWSATTSGAAADRHVATAAPEESEAVGELGSGNSPAAEDLRALVNGSLDELAIAPLWVWAQALGLSKTFVLKRARAVDPDVRTVAQITNRQLLAIIEEWMAK